MRELQTGKRLPVSLPSGVVALNQAIKSNPSLHEVAGSVLSGCAYNHFNQCSVAEMLLWRLLRLAMKVPGSFWHVH